MTTRERYLNTLRFRPVDRPPLLAPGGPWATTLARWHREGLPEGVTLEEFFGLETLAVAPVGIDTLLWPRFEEKVLRDDGRCVVHVNAEGVTVRDLRDGVSMPEFLDYPVKGPQDLPSLARRLCWDTPGRVTPGWRDEALARQRAGQIVFCNGGMYFAFLNEHMGTERLMYTYFDRPDFIHAVNELLCTLCERALTTALPAVPLDYIGYHEDMAYKNGSLISPAMFREFMTPYYRRVTAIAHAHGCDVHVMDSDGDIRELIPLWLECGINVVAPVEVAAGMDVVALRRRYGRELRMMGGFDKRILAGPKVGIRREFARLAPVIEEGGYLPGCDHGVPHNVPFENYRYLVELLKGLYGMV
jgi:hypothetical protein